MQQFTLPKLDETRSWWPMALKLLPWVVLAALLAWTYHGAIGRTFFVWWHQQADYGHGFLVVPFALFLLLYRSQIITGEPPDGIWESGFSAPWTKVGIYVGAAIGLLLFAILFTVNQAHEEMPAVQLDLQAEEVCLVQTGDAMPEAELPDQQGDSHALAELRGSALTVVYFWQLGKSAEENELAVGDLKELKNKQAPRADSGVRVVAVNVGQTPDDLRRLADQEKIPPTAEFMLLADEQGDLLKQVAAGGAPRIYLLDAAGQIIWFDAEYDIDSRRDLDQAIRASLSLTWLDFSAWFQLLLSAAYGGALGGLVFLVGQVVLGSSLIREPADPGQCVWLIPLVGAWGLALLASLALVGWLMQLVNRTLGGRQLPGLFEVALPLLGVVLPMLAVAAVFVVGCHQISRRWPSATQPLANSQYWWLLPILGLWVLLRWMSFHYVYRMVDAYSILPLLAAVALLAGGWRVMLWAWPSIVFLFFMLPLPGPVSDKLSQPLQLLGTRVSVYVIQTLGIAASFKGNIIEMQGGDLEVARACSGLRMLVLFFAICVGVAFVIRRTWWEKIVIVVSAVPIAIIANVARLTVTAILYEMARRWPDVIDAHKAEEIIHDWSGYLIMMPLAMLLLWVELTLLSKLFLEPAAKGPLSLGRTLAGVGPAAAGSGAGKRRASYKGPSQMGPGQTGSGQTGSGQTGSGQTGSGDAGPRPQPEPAPDQGNP